MVLDDLRKIHERDTQDLLGAIARQNEQPTRELELKGGRLHAARNVVYGAMGGSALPGLFVPALASIRVPMEVVRDYDLPAYVGDDTLFIAASFSGNTEETLAALKQAEARGAQIAVITNGGQLRRIAEGKGYMLAVLPGFFPRFSLWQSVRALLQILETAGMLGDDFRPQLEAVTRQLSTAAQLWCPEAAARDNQAKQTALELMGKSVAVYSGPKLYPAAYKWKLSCNESAKQVAWTGQYPESNHNDFTGWSKQPVEKPYAVVELRSSLEHPRIQKRFTESERLLSGMRPAPIVVTTEGRTLPEQLAWSALLGDYVGVYLALLNGLDPAPLPLVDKLKQAMNPSDQARNVR